MNAQVISAQASVLVLVDYQSRLMPAIHEGARIVSRALMLARAAGHLDIPVLGTEQNPSRLGANEEALRGHCASTVAKTHFDACEDGLLQAIERLRPQASQLVLAGCEAHVCLLQTALGLIRAGFQVWVVENASGSRRPSDHAAAMARLAQAGATIVTHEMVLFEWLHDCRHPRFAPVLQLIKSGD